LPKYVPIAEDVPMIDHLSLGVADLTRSMAFYDAILAPLGYVRLFADDRCVGYGVAGYEEKLALFAVGESRPAGRGWHVALTAPSLSAVDAFFAAALQHGGSDEGAPGKRPQYGTGYYAAFCRDPDGHKLEAVHHG
jgi:catechol 2,3-dioxygenase-like lactoylglutathione lyase family enzyme